MRVRAAVLEAPQGAVRVETMFLGEPGPGEVLLRMEACGVCHSDLFVAGLVKLPLAPLTLGHEGIGRVVSVGPEAGEWRPGDRAGVTFLGVTCGACEWCLSGRRRFCPRQTNFGYTLQGVMAESVCVPAAALVRVPEDLSAAEAAPLCCAGWTAAGALREAAVTAGETVALFGFGGLGHLALQLAQRLGARVAAVDVSAEKLAAARADGAGIALPAEEAGRALQKEFGGVDAALVLTPSQAAIHQAFKALKRNGRLVLVGLAARSFELPLVDTVLKGIQIRGSYLGTQQDLDEVFELARQGIIRAHAHTHGIEEVPAILEQMRRGEVSGRAVIAF